MVHHINGDRLDNRLENPRGQRVEDKLDFAYALLRLYDRDACEALGLDLGPGTGLPLNDESPSSD